MWHGIDLEHVKTAEKSIFCHETNPIVPPSMTPYTTLHPLLIPKQFCWGLCASQSVNMSHMCNGGSSQTKCFVPPEVQSPIDCPALLLFFIFPFGLFKCYLLFRVVGEHAKVVRDIREQWSVKALTWLCSSSAVVFEVDLRVLHAGVKWFVRKFVPLSSQKQIL